MDVTFLRRCGDAIGSAATVLLLGSLSYQHGVEGGSLIAIVILVAPLCYVAAMTGAGRARDWLNARWAARRARWRYDVNDAHATDQSGVHALPKLEDPTHPQTMRTPQGLN